MKLQFQKLNLSENDVLNRSQMKKLKGGYTPGCFSDASGGTSCWHDATWSDYECGLTNAEAQAKQAENGGLWCHDSCADSCLKNGEY